MRGWQVGFVAAALPLALVAPASGETVTAPRVKPGLSYTTSDGTGCSFAFLLRGSDGHDYVATAGHCALEENGTRLWPAADGPAVRDDRGVSVGRFVLADLRGGADAVDFALVRLDAGLRGDPQMCAWGGPTRLLTDEPTGRVELRHNGGGIGYSAVVPSRTAYANGIPRRQRVYALGLVSFGDSGSGTTTADGAAVGVSVVLTAGVDGGWPVAMGLQRLDVALADAERALGVRFALRTAPVLPEPPPTQRC